VVVAEEGVAVADWEVAHPADSPRTAQTSAAAAIHRPLPLDRNRVTPCLRACSGVVAEAAESGEGVSWGLACSWLLIVRSSDVAELFD
jgi:hypothetical protein